jgi:hypothetical protein
MKLVVGTGKKRRVMTAITESPANKRRLFLSMARRDNDWGLPDFMGLYLLAKL